MFFNNAVPSLRGIKNAIKRHQLRVCYRPVDHYRQGFHKLSLTPRVLRTNVGVEGRLDEDLRSVLWCGRSRWLCTCCIPGDPVFPTSLAHLTESLHTQPTPATLRPIFLSLQDFASSVRGIERFIVRGRERIVRRRCARGGRPLFSPLRFPRSPRSSTIELESHRAAFTPNRIRAYSSSSYSNDCGFFFDDDDDDARK